MRTVVTTRKMDSVFQAVERAAEAGERCPTNGTLADIAGCSPPNAVRILQVLEQAGRIVVERFGASRTVRIVATGSATAAYGLQNPHFRALSQDGLTGEQLVDNVRLAAIERGVSAVTLAEQLSRDPRRWLHQTVQAARPTAATVARVEALLAGNPLPLPPVSVRRVDPLSGAVRIESGPTPTTAPLDRDPCTWCGIRGDIGCSCGGRR